MQFNFGQSLAKAQLVCRVWQHLGHVSLDNGEDAARRSQALLSTFAYFAHDHVTHMASTCMHFLPRPIAAQRLSLLRCQKQLDLQEVATTAHISVAERHWLTTRSTGPISPSDVRVHCDCVNTCISQPEGCQTASRLNLWRSSKCAGIGINSRST